MFLFDFFQGGGGPMAVLPFNKPGKVPIDLPLIAGHAGPVLDFEFNPFADDLLASASEDSTIKLWRIPEGGVTSNISTPLVDLTGHARKVTLLRFHPTASNVLLSTSADQTVKVWDIEKGYEINTLSDVHDQLIQEIVWDTNGNQYATTSKDKSIRVVDGRTAQVSQVIENSHEGTKSIKLTYINQNRLLSVGFSRTSIRQVKIWDPRNTTTEVFKLDLDQAAGSIMPFFDHDTNLLYLAGKGDGNVRCYEISHEADNIYACTDFRSNISAKGMAFVPKRGLNILHNETARLLKLTTNSVEPLSFIVPRKSEGFQEDLFPDSFSGEASHTADEWLAGSDLPPKLASLNPGVRSNTPTPKSSASFASGFKSNAELQQELTKANARIKELEERLKAANLSVD